jgi:hypothetical protein
MRASLLYIAALCAVVVSLAHSILGERRLIGPVADEPAPSAAVLKSKRVQRVLRSTWHGVSLNWIVQAAILVVVAQIAPPAQGSAIVGVIGASFLIMAAISFAASGARHIGWPLLAATGVAGLAASFVS